MNGWRSVVIAILLSIGCVTAYGAEKAPSVLDVGAFSQDKAGGLPSGWKPLTFRKISRHTEYKLVHEDGQVVVRAVSQDAASGLIHNIRIDPYKYPIISWRWKVANLVEHSDVRRKSGDDYPARIYVVFRSDRDALSPWEKLKVFFYRLFTGEELPTGAINYVWGRKAPVNTTVPNAYTARVRMIVVDSGGAQVGHWVNVERNILVDYRSAFGQAAPPIVGVAVMTDTDNTHESATAWYGDIMFKKLPPRAAQK